MTRAAAADFSALRGRLISDAPLAGLTWFRVGGAADMLFTPQDPDDLACFLRVLPVDIPVMALGVGSNLLVRDGGVDGAVVRLGKSFSAVSVTGDELVAGAGTPDIAVAGAARDHALAGFEFLRGIPGTIGGAVKMNAGAYGAEISDILISVEVMDRQGHISVLTAEDLQFSYRHSALPSDMICLSARFRGRPDDKDRIKQRMQDIVASREESQPLRTRTGGSSFKNPPGQAAWKLIDAAGCRGLVCGGAMVSEKHCNFLINQGTATARDIEELGEIIKKRVKAMSGIELIWEIHIIGRMPKS